MYAKVVFDVRDQLVERWRELWATGEDDLHLAGPRTLRKPARDAFARFDSPAELCQIGTIEEQFARDPRIINEGIHRGTLPHTEVGCVATVHGSCRASADWAMIAG